MNTRQAASARRRQRGQATLEYAMVSAVLAAALFVAEWDGRTIGQYLADAVRLFFQNLTYFLSLP